MTAPKTKEPIVISPDYTIEHDSYHWILNHWHTVKPRKKGGTPTRRNIATYHAILRQVARHIIDKELRECTSLHQILNQLDHAEDLVTRVIETEVANHE